jgi:hypothetical protein
MRLFPFVESVMSALCTGAPWVLQQLGEKRDHCEGDCRLLDQLGEKQDFEAELSRLGLGHEALPCTFFARPQKTGEQSGARTTP